LFQQATIPGVPTCFYDTIPQYAASNIQYQPTGITMDLTLLENSTSAQAAAAPRVVSDPLSGKISSLKLSVTYHTENMLQVKVILTWQLLIFFLFVILLSCIISP
jgi:maltase-glucoamylase